MLQVEADQLRRLPVGGQHPTELIVVHQQQLQLLLAGQACSVEMKTEHELVGAGW